MTILCVAADLIQDGLGGAEHHCVEVVKRLSLHNKIHLFVGQNNSIKSQFNNNVQVHSIWYPKIPNLSGLSYIFFGLPQIIFALKTSKIKPDLIWSKQCFPQAPLSTLLKTIIKTPHYITVQNPRLLSEELVLKGILSRFQLSLVKLLEPLIGWSLKNANIVACVSQYSASQAKSMGAKNIIIIPNGINSLRQSKPFPSPISKRSFKIITISSLIPRNGIDTLISAVALLPKSLKWQLNIAGDGPEKNNLNKLVIDNNSQDRVLFLGRVSNKSVPELLSKSDLFVRPSRYEGFGVAFLEAMSAGVPVIATPVGGIPDFIAHQETGLLVQPNQPQQLADAIKSLLTDVTLRNKLTLKAQALVQEKYNWDTIAQDVESAMEKLI